MNTPAETEKAAMQRQLDEIKEQVLGMTAEQQFAVNHLAATVRTVLASDPVGPVVLALLGAEAALAACDGS